MHFYRSIFQIVGQQGLSSNAIFAPIVTATCRAGMMTVKVETLDNFLGVVQSRDHRKPECSGYGENSRITYLRINMLAQSSDPEYCGVFINEVKVSDTTTFFVILAVEAGKAAEQKMWENTNGPRLRYFLRTFSMNRL